MVLVLLDGILKVSQPKYQIIWIFRKCNVPPTDDAKNAGCTGLGLPVLPGRRNVKVKQTRQY